MSKILKEFNFELFENKLSHGKWDKYLDGKIHELKLGEDYERKQQVYAMVANRRVKGIKIKLAFPTENTAVIQLVKKPHHKED